MRRVMICGGAGFLGSHLADHLLADGDEVDVVDDLSCGSLVNLADARTAAGRFKFQNAVVGSESFAELVARRRPEVIVNLVCLVPSRRGPEEVLASLPLAAAVLEAARHNAVQKVVTTLPAKSVYGEMPSKAQPVKEGHFGEARTVDQVVARAVADLHTVYRDSHAVEFTVLATGHVYGPRQRPEDSVVAAFVDAIVKGRPAIVHGTGRQTRDFIYVDDAVEAAVAALDRAGGLVLNVGTGEATSVADLWGVLAGSAGPRPRGSSARANDVSRLALSPVRSRIHLGWSARTDLATGLGRTRAAVRPD
jgi:UDP-glucose 4-epimerase